MYISLYITYIQIIKCFKKYLNFYNNFYYYAHLPLKYSLKKKFIYLIYNTVLGKTWLLFCIMVMYRENVCINLNESVWNRTIGGPVEHGDEDSSKDRWLWRSFSPGSSLFFLGLCNSGRSDPDGGALCLPPHPASPLVGPTTMLLYHISFSFPFSVLLLHRVQSDFIRIATVWFS